MTDRNYLTIGELARRVGVTVRTIQYYDQQGLLSPSAKGPQNQRLYTDDNVKDLYRILTLKYLGLSLARSNPMQLFTESRQHCRSWQTSRWMLSKSSSNRCSSA